MSHLGASVMDLNSSSDEDMVGDCCSQLRHYKTLALPVDSFPESGNYIGKYERDIVAASIRQCDDVSTTHHAVPETNETSGSEACMSTRHKS